MESVNHDVKFKKMEMLNCVNMKIVFKKSIIGKQVPTQ